LFPVHRLYNGLRRLHDWIFNQRNPLLQVSQRPTAHLPRPTLRGPTAGVVSQLLYLGLYWGCFITYAMLGWSRMREGRPFFSCLLVAVCMMAFHLACTIPAGYITEGAAPGWLKGPSTLAEAQPTDYSLIGTTLRLGPIFGIYFSPQASGREHHSSQPWYAYSGWDASLLA
jgi:hypothetical protein